MVQLTQDTSSMPLVPPTPSIPQTQGSRPPPSDAAVTQPQQLIHDRSQLGIKTQLSPNGTQRTHSKPPSGIPHARNGYPDPPYETPRRRDPQDRTQGHRRVPQDPRSRMGYFHREERHRRSREGDGKPVEGLTEGKEGGSGDVDTGEGRRRPPYLPYPDTSHPPHPPRSLPRHFRDRRDHGRDRVLDGGDRNRREPRDCDRELARDHERDRERDRDPNRERDITRDRNRDRDPNRERDLARDRTRDRERDIREHERERDRNRDRERDIRERDIARDRDRNREHDIRNRDQERDREQDRDRNRDTRNRDHEEPRRREPVGEETGYDSDHSRMSRSTAISYSSRSLPRRHRADSVTSHASRSSVRTSARPRGYEMYDLYNQYDPYTQYYKDYYQWMKQYRQAYQSESFYDDHTSIHSGRSSVNNDAVEKSVSSQFLQDFHGSSALGHFEPSPIYPEGSLSRLKSYPSGELSGAPSVGDDTVSEAAPRMTPVHFGRPHISARFTPSGQLVMVLPKDPRDGEKAVVQLRDVQKMLSLDPAESRAIHQMKNYSGPLTLSDTHKDVVMKYCEQQAAEAGRSLTLPDKESVMLIWEYLALLVKQNGKLFGSDIAGLLLKGREVGPASTQSTNVEEPSEEGTTDASPHDEGIDLPSHPLAPVPCRDEAALLRKFTEYLCLGRKKEAVDYAIREGLWGHALALAYKMDTTTHTRVLAAFMNHIPRTDVVVTLFQQLSGKKPEITKSYNPQHWGDWRQHLAVMISNPTGVNHKDQSSIVALGDTLASRGQLHAAHFCYLVAEVNWGSYTCKDSKLVLIGASHHLPFQAFATIEAIQCTEVYEFARSLDGNNSPQLETFQSYKLVYALRLTECGFPAEALRYCEVISQSVEKNPTAYKTEFLSQVYDLASCLKYHDLHYQMYQGEVSEMPDPQWLTNLRSVLDSARQREHQQRMDQQQDTTRTEPQHYPHVYQNQTATDQNQTSEPVYPDTNQHVPLSDQQGLSYNAPTHYHQPEPMYAPQPSPDVLDASHYTSPRSPSKAAEGAMNRHPQAMMGPPQGLPQEEVPSAVESPMMPQPSPEHSHYTENTYQGTYHQQEQYPQPSTQPPTGYDQGSEQMTNDTPIPQPNSQESYMQYQPQEQYQQWGQSPPQPQPQPPPQQQDSGMSSPDAPPKPTEPSPQPQRTPEEEAYWAEMSNKKSGDSGNKTKETGDDTKMEEDKKSAGKENKGGNAKKGGWLTSWLGWKSSTPQAVLPDDKNPQIVWNPDKKKWVNKDGTEETTASVGPPPKMPQLSRGLPPSVSRSANRITRYVDPVKDKTPPPPAAPPAGGTGQGSPMLPPMPMNPPSVSPSLLVPQPMQPSQENTDLDTTQPSQQHQPQTQPQQQHPPQNPDVAQMKRRRYISESSIDLEEDWPAAKTEGTLSEDPRSAVPMMAPPMAQPQFFDPTKFKPSATTPVNPARRAGPGRRSFPANR